MQAPFPDIELTALLGRGTRFEGKLHFEGRVRIDGTFRGEIRSEGTLIVGEGARVHADVYVGTLIVKGGMLAGLVQAVESIELHVPAQVTGHLTAPEIFMDKGVQFSGECTIVSKRDAAGSAAPMSRPT
jgi:cytoskeletal protein CcmA (bactofilin family)